MDLDSVTEVTGIAQARYDILLLVQHRIDRCAPEGDIVAIVQHLTHIIDRLRRSDGAT